MKERFLNYSINLIKNNNNFDEVKLAELKYGLEAFYMLCTKMFVIICISLLLNLTWELILFLLFFTPLRGFGFGFHANSNLECWIISVPVFVIIPYLIKSIHILPIIAMIIIIFSSISFLLFGPADTEKRPLINHKRRLVQKCILVFTSLVYLYLSIIIKNNLIVNAIVFACLWQSISVNPLMYKLFNQPFNNYKTYLKEV